MMFNVKFELRINRGDTESVVRGERTYGTLDEAVAHVAEGMRQFGEPDAGPQILAFTLLSEP